MSQFRWISLMVLACTLLAAAGYSHAMGTAFSYQGSLEDGGAPANGVYDFEFRLINTNGTTIGTNLRDAVPVVQGVFTVELNYGNVAAAFTGQFERFLEIGIRPTGSGLGYTFLAPLTPINPVPFAQRAALVTDNGVVATSIAPNAVIESRINDAAVTTTKLADSAVASAKLANSAVTNAKLANNAVTNAKVAAGTLTMSRHAGAFFNGGIGSLIVGPFGCLNFTVPVGGALAGDFPLVALQAGAVLPTDLSLTALRVPSDGIVEMRACNSGNTTRSWSSLNLIFLTLR